MLETAERALRAAIAAKPDHAPAQLALGALLFDSERLDEAAAVLEQIPAMTEAGQSARAKLALIGFRRTTVATAGRIAQAEPETPEGEHLAAGNRLAAAGDYRGALEQFLWLVEHNRRYGDDEGRRATLAVFNILGPDDPITVEYRPRLSSLLF